MEIRFDPDELEGLVEFLRYGEGRIAAAVLPGPIAGDALIERIRQALGDENVRVTESADGYPEPVLLGETARELAPEGGIFVIPLDGRWHSEDVSQVRDFWRRLNYQREHLATEGVCTLLLLDDASDRYLMLEADDLREWVRVFRFPEALQISRDGSLAALSSSSTAPGSEKQIDVLRDQLRRAREIGLPEAEITEQYSIPLFVELMRNDRAKEARQVWDRELRGGEAVSSWELPQRVNLWAAKFQLALFEGSLEKAQELSRSFLKIAEEQEDLPSLAISYHQLGLVAEERGSYEEAWTWYRKSLAISEELGDRSGIAISYHQLGMVSQARGSYDEALTWYRKSLEVFKELGNRSGLAISYHQLGRVSQERGSYEEALSWYRKSLEIEEELGNRSGLAISYHQLGLVAIETDKPEEGVAWHVRSLLLALELRLPEASKPLGQLVREEDLLGKDRFQEILDEHLDEENRDHVLSLMEEYRQARQETETD